MSWSHRPKFTGLAIAAEELSGYTRWQHRLFVIIPIDRGPSTLLYSRKTEPIMYSSWWHGELSSLLPTNCPLLYTMLKKEVLLWVSVRISRLKKSRNYYLFLLILCVIGVHERKTSFLHLKSGENGGLNEQISTNLYRRGKTRRMIDLYWGEMRGNSSSLPLVPAVW